MQVTKFNQFNKHVQWDKEYKCTFFLIIHSQKGWNAGNLKLFMTITVGAGLGGIRNCTTWTLLPVVWTLSATSQLHKICYLSIFLCTVYMCANNLKLLQSTGPVKLGGGRLGWGGGPCPILLAMVCLIKTYFLKFLFFTSYSKLRTTPSKFLDVPPLLDKKNPYLIDVLKCF